MRAAIYRLDLSLGKVSKLGTRSMVDLKKTEPYHLEQWLVGAGEDVFGREILWIARQDRTTDDERSDLVGVDEDGSLVVAELKRAELDESHVAQALTYTAEYAEKTRADLAEMFAQHSMKETRTGLVSRAKTKEDASVRLGEFVGSDCDLNTAQIVLLVAEKFSAKALSVCDYLNRVTGVAFSVECWQYSICEDSGVYYLVVEQVLPVRTVREAVSDMRTETTEAKYQRDPGRTRFMHMLKEFLQRNGRTVQGRKGASYVCWIAVGSGEATRSVELNIWGEHPALVPPIETSLPPELPDAQLSRVTDAWHRQALEFRDVSTADSEFSDDFGNRVLAVLAQLT